jgi:ribosome-associated toxin RatA of RatAB toxin-antitoxin module
VRDLHSHWHLPLLQSEISNLKFEIAYAFAFAVGARLLLDFFRSLFSR